MCATGVAHFHEAALEKCFFERIAPRGAQRARKSRASRERESAPSHRSFLARPSGESRAGCRWKEGAIRRADNSDEEPHETLLSLPAGGLRAGSSEPCATEELYEEAPRQRAC